MRVFSATVVAVAVVVLSLVVPTGAALGDEVWEEEGVVVSPHDGGNGRYASIDGDGDLRVDFGDQLNPDAVTTFVDVFDVGNEGDHRVRVWVTHDATEHVEFNTDGAGSIQGEENGVLLSPGDVAVVDVALDTHGAAPGEDLVDEVAIHVRREPEATASGDNPSPLDPPVRRVAVDAGTVRVAFDDGARTDRSVSVQREDGLPAGSSSFGVRPVIVRTDGDFATAEPAASVDDRLADLGADAVVAPGESVVLSGTETVVDSPAAISPGAVAVYDVAVTPAAADGRATIWTTLPRSEFGGDDPGRARAARQVGDGWQLLETRVESANASHVTVAARTAGVSRFAVLPRSELSFLWSVEERGRMRSEDVKVSYDEPGIYAARLVVTDGLGRRGATTYRLLVNDRPSLTVEGPAVVTPGEPVRLRADVEDRFGETTVTWQFADGSEAEGPSATRSFGPGEHVVTVRAEDEFGANATVERRVIAGDGVVQVVQFALGVEGRLALVGLASLVVVGLLRWLVARTGGEGRRRPG